MSANLSNKIEQPVTKRHSRRWWLVLGLPAWVAASFVLAQIVVSALIIALRSAGVQLSVLNPSIFETVAAASVYVLTLAIVIMVPWWVRRISTTKNELGITRLPSWMDIGLAPAGFVLYLLASGIVVYLLTTFVPGFDGAAPQEVGFDNLTNRFEYLLAFFTLVVVAPVAEEAIFRGYLYGKLRKSVSVWLTVLATSLLFALLHMNWSDGTLAGVNVAVDVFVLSLVMCSLREITGNIWAGVLLHMMKNGLAFYFLFINPQLLHTIGG
ncbi:MAG TPA: type II CAAX endopeptidase family protein [Candidatus Saccharimonadales bacterium]